MGSFLSATALVTGNAVKLAAADAKRQLLECALEILEVDSIEKLDTESKKIFLKKDPQKSITFSQAIQASVFKRNGDPIVGKGSYKGYPRTDRYPSLAKAKGLFTGAYGFAAQAAEVEIDTLTGRSDW